MTIFSILREKWLKFDLQTTYDYMQTTWSNFPTVHKRVLIGLIPIIFILSIIPIPHSQNMGIKPTESKRIPLTLMHQNENAQYELQETKAIESSAWITYTIKNGDTLSKVFRHNDLSISDLNALIRIEGSDKPLSNIKPGQLIRFKFSHSGQLDILQLEKGNKSVMYFRLSDGGFGRSQ